MEHVVVGLLVVSLVREWYSVCGGRFGQKKGQVGVVVVQGVCCVDGWWSGCVGPAGSCLAEFESQLVRTRA